MAETSSKKLVQVSADALEEAVKQELSTVDRKRNQIDCVASKLGDECSRYHSLEEKVSHLKAICQKMTTIAEVMQDEPVASSVLQARLDIDASDEWLLGDVFPALLEAACAEDAAQDQDQEQGEKSVPGQTWLRLAFFRLKVETDSRNEAKSKLERLQSRRGRLQDQLDRRKDTKRRNAQRTIEKKERKEKSWEEQLSRRNQINRLRRGVKRARIVRKEEELPEASRACCMLLFIVQSRALFRGLDNVIDR